MLPERTVVAAAAVGGVVAVTGLGLAPVAAPVAAAGLPVSSAGLGPSASAPAQDASPRLSSSQLRGNGEVWPAVAQPASGSPTATVQAPAIRSTSANVGGAYTALSPYRLVDTRAGSGQGYAGQTLGPGTTLNFQVTGIDTVPADATAVALNVTVTDTTSASYLTVFPSGSGGPPLASNVNWPAADTVPNLVIVPVGTGGQVSAYNANGDTDLVVDLEGYFAAESGGSAGSYGALSPYRITDTRAGSGKPNSGKTLGPGGILNIQVSNAGGGLPSSAADIDAVLLNMTVTDTTAPSYLTVYPAGNSRPTASNLNWSAGVTIANRVVVPINRTSGQITVYNANGAADVVVDVDGYFSTSVAPANASLYTAVAPVRFIDTRSGSGEPGAGQTLGPGEELPDQLSQVGSLGSDVTAVVSNVTATDTGGGSYLTVYPVPSTRPLASDLNWYPGDTVANLTVATVGSDGAVGFFNDLGDADLVVDVFGYFSATPTLGTEGAYSSNWSGYVETDGPQTSVTGSFIVPALSRNQPVGAATSEWVGVDGWFCPAPPATCPLIQAGITDFMSTATSFSLMAWWEILPAYATPITAWTNLAPGDAITVTISHVSGTNWSIAVDDATQHETFITNQTYTGPAQSADWILEAPQISGLQATLADYTEFPFSKVAASGPDTTDTWVVMVQKGAIVSVPSDVGEGGTSFKMAYGAAVPAPP